MSFIKKNNIYVNQFFTTGSTVSGSITQTIVGEIVIPAFTYDANRLIMLSSMFSKTGTAGIGAQRFYWVEGNVATLSGALNISLTNFGATTAFLLTERRLFIHDVTPNVTPAYNNGTEVITSTTTQSSDYLATTATNVQIDWTVDGVIFTTITLASSSDSATCQYLKIWEW